jgi:ribosomal-protein-alanine N-acetyltransferase
LRTFHVRPFTREDADAIATWKYDGPYAFYDSDADDDDLAMILDPQNWEDMYYAAEDDRGQLVGFFQFERDGDTVEIGLGLRPDLTGRGLGLSFIQVGLAFAQSRYAPKTFRLAVAAFNLRAITVYERAGFRRTRTYQHETNGGIHEFIEMVRSASE